MKKGVYQDIWDNAPTATLLYGQHASKAFAQIEPHSVQLIATSPPYSWPRNYRVPDVKMEDGWEGQLGREPTPDLYAEHLVDVFDKARSILRPDAVVFVNLADNYVGGGGYVPTSPSNTKTATKKRGFGGHGAGTVTGGIPTSCGIKAKSLALAPFRFVTLMVDRGWICRSTIIWHKPSVTPQPDPTKLTVDHEYVFMFSMNRNYYFDGDPLRRVPSISASYSYTPGESTEQEGPPPSQERRPLGRSVWHISTEHWSGTHKAVWPKGLVRPMIQAATSSKACPQCRAPWRRVKGDQRVPSCPCPNNDGSAHCIVLDPFSGSGTTGEVALEENADFIGIDLQEDYFQEAMDRVQGLGYRGGQEESTDPSTYPTIFTMFRNKSG